jgi:hypothetical protein
LKISYLIFLVGLAMLRRAINGGRRDNPQNGRAFEVISVGEDPSGDGYTYAMPGSFDGLGVVAGCGQSVRQHQPRAGGCRGKRGESEPRTSNGNSQRH